MSRDVPVARAQYTNSVSKLSSLRQCKFLNREINQNFSTESAGETEVFEKTSVMGVYRVSAERCDKILSRWSPSTDHKTAVTPGVIQFYCYWWLSPLGLAVVAYSAKCVDGWMDGWRDGWMDG
ncbi:hypothetical protein ElyMa_005685100 [Elysia marginata]|uniref:Uncharacterized protein n=1 Tax=Elysia marginata TaxID=1093978 RepID=A0AAV4FED7_9GAST|nr:hypothetical protein ElyMa_005685100 [Elysia marginata]